MATKKIVDKAAVDSETIDNTTSAPGFFVLENKNGQIVRYFNFESAKVVVVYRHDNRRIEAVSTVKDLEHDGISFDILGEATPAKIRKEGLAIAGVGAIRFVHQIGKMSPQFDLAAEEQLDTKKTLGWAAGLPIGLAGIMIIAGALTGNKPKEEAQQVTILDKAQVEQMLQEKLPEPAKPEKALTKAERRAEARHERQQSRKIVVAPSETKITKHTPVPTKSTRNAAVKTVVKTVANHKPHGGGFKGAAQRGYGTNEQNMNSIGALASLNGPRVKGGNGGRGGLNLQAVGNEAGSGAGGQGHGGFGSNGGGGHGKGGLGTGKGMGLSNAMYGKGLIAAPFGDGSPAPGSGGYGTRGKAGGGAQGAGYGTETIVGSWKGTGPKGNGPAGSGSGNGDPNGSPWGSADGDDGDAVVTGGLSRDQIAEVINRNLGQITYCYEQGLQRQASLAGRVSVRFQIGGSGRVSTARVSHSSVHSAQVESCIVGKLKTWSFPHPQGGVTVGVTYPFVLTRSSK